MRKKTSFWNRLKRPFSVLAPMADVTDPPYRSIIAKYGPPDVFYTQFVSCDGLQSEGRAELMLDLGFTKNEHPIVVQFFGANPENFYASAKLAKKLGFDGVDINMGCPDKNVMKQGSGASLIKNSGLAKEIVAATKEGAGGLPISIKTRVGDTKDELDTWIPELLSTKPAALILHARTRKQMSKVPANWEYVQRTVEMAKSSDTLIIGNGDVMSISQGQSLAQNTGADGIMYGRAIFGNPWFFNTSVQREDLTLAQRLSVLLEHTLAFEKYFGSRKNFAVMKRHFKSYVDGFPGAKNLRIKLMNCTNASEVAEILTKEITANVT